MASSSSSIPIMTSSSFSISGSNPPKYDVFLSFRGEDTRKNFTCHLNDALIRSGIVTFIDNREVETGDEISSTLSNAIRSSSLSIIIFSQNYASSPFCLNELLEIIECYETWGQIILPIFYHVSPFDISKQNGTYGEALAKHEERFTKDKVQKWRAALAQVAELAGSELKPDDKQLETEFIEKIVKDVLGKLNRISSADHLDPGLVGIRSRVETVKSLLCLESKDDICIIGIWGMGGIGKTTIARVVYNRIANQFKAVCFLENVRNDATNGLNHLQKKLLSGILGEGNHYMNDFTIRRLCTMKILIVIDDVDDPEHLKALVGDRSWFGLGSRIIVTSRDRQVLKNGVDEFKLYEVEGLNDVEARELFILNAFKQSHSSEDRMELLREFVHYAKGNPLALKVLGCSLLGKSMEDWKSVLDKLKKCPHSKILEVLKISCDMLDSEEREIFLFIACFFKGKEIMDRVTNILDGCGFSTKSGISYLVDKCLLTITYDNRLSMHDLIQKMGRHVVQKSVKEPGKRSRLWDPQEICDLFKKNTGTGAVESISLDLSQINELYISPDAFTRMPNLKLLKFYFSTLDDWRYDGLLALDDGRYHWRTASGDWRYNKWRKEMHKVKIIGERLESLSDELRYLCWHGYPWESLPMKFNPEHLVDLEMPHSKLQHLWNDTKSLGKLRRIDLNGCTQLTEVLDPSQATNLESMKLGFCSSLTQFPKISCNVMLTRLCLTGTAIEEVPKSAIKCLSTIVSLDFRHNKRLRKLPSMRHLTSLKELDLEGCSKITKFPKISGAIAYLGLTRTAIKEVPYSAIEHLSKIVTLDMSFNKRLRKLPSMVHLTSLEKLDLGFCSNITEFPDIPNSVEITRLCLSGTGIEEVPSFVGRLTKLGYLYLDHCIRLKNVSSSIFQLNLGGLFLSQCSKLENFPEVLENEGMPPNSLRNLTNHSDTDDNVTLYMCMSCSKNLESLPSSFCNLTSLRRLDLYGCPGVEKMLEKVLLSSPSGLRSLRSLDLSECNMEVLPNALSHLSYLDELNLRGNEFESLSLELFTSLRQLNISYCKRLRYLKDFPLPSRLNELNARNCTSLETLPDKNGLSANYGCFYYYHNCCKLDERARINIQENAWSMTQHMDSFSFRDTECKIRGWTTEWFEVEEKGWQSFCFPGSEIPDWFIYQNQGSSIKIDLPPHWYSDKFVGFVVCIVASCESSNHNNLSFVKCKCKIKDPDCDGQDITFHFPNTSFEYPKSDHVFIKSILPDAVRVGSESDDVTFLADRKPSKLSSILNMTQFADFRFILNMTQHDSPNSVRVDSESDDVTLPADPELVYSRFNTKNPFWEKARFRFKTSKGCCKVKKCGINLVYSEWEDQVLETVMMTPRGRKKKIATLNQQMASSATVDEY